MTDITFVMQAVIAFAAAVVTILFIPWLRAKHDEEEVKIFLRWVEIAVAAAEQLYDASAGLKKKAYVIKWLEKKGYTANAEEINAAIEAAVLKLHAELRRGNKDDKQP